MAGYARTLDKIARGADGGPHPGQARRPNRFAGTPASAHALLVLAEAAAELFVILSGHAEVWPQGHTATGTLEVGGWSPSAGGLALLDGGSERDNQEALLL